MDQLYERWLQSQKAGWGEEAANNSVRENGKQIHMPTDYAEEVVSLHVDVQLVSQPDFSWYEYCCCALSWLPIFVVRIKIQLMSNVKTVQTLEILLDIFIFQVIKRC